MGKNTTYDSLCLSSSLIGFFMAILFFFFTVVYFEQIDKKFQVTYFLFVNSILSSLVVISYLSGTLAIFKKVRDKGTRIWMVIIGWMISAPILIYLLLSWAVFIISGGKF